MSKLIPKKLTFMAKYGTEADRAKVSEHVDGLLDRAGNGEPGLFHDLATSSEIPLNSNQIHRIIDSPKFPGLNHPVGQLARWHFGDLKDEHWDKIARSEHISSDVSSIIAHMPKEHLRTVVQTHREPFIRQLAAQAYAHRTMK